MPSRTRRRQRRQLRSSRRGLHSRGWTSTLAVALSGFFIGGAAAAGVLWLFSGFAPSHVSRSKPVAMVVAQTGDGQTRQAERLTQIVPAAGGGTSVPYVEGVPLPELQRMELERRHMPVPSAPVDTKIVRPAPRTVSAVQPPWRRYAALAPPTDGRPMVAIVLDDVGLSQYRSDRVIALPRPVTLAILPYGKNLPGLVARARAAGHEILVHMPMEATDPGVDPGPLALLSGQDRLELDRRLRRNLSGFGGYVGINNHMGSRLTASPQAMDVVMRALRERGLLFLDSLTTGRSVAAQAAADHDVPMVARDIFIDAVRDEDFIRRQLALVEQTARRKGYVIAIGHPYPETLRALDIWLPLLAEKGLAQVPVSAIATARLSG